MCYLSRKLQNKIFLRKSVKNCNFKVKNLSFKNASIAERVKCCDMEDRTVVAYGCWKTKMLICGMEGENVVAYRRLPPPPFLTLRFRKFWFYMLHCNLKNLYISSNIERKKGRLYSILLDPSPLHKFEN